MIRDLAPLLVIWLEPGLQAVVVATARGPVVSMVQRNKGHGLAERDGDRNEAHFATRRASSSAKPRWKASSSRLLRRDDMVCAAFSGGPLSTGCP